MILYFAADLLWATKIKGTADALGLPCRPARSVEMLEARLGDEDVQALVVDLDAPETALALIERARREERHIRVLAFGPHVDHDSLKAAKEAGADGVMTRGGFHGRLGEILQELSGETDRS